MSQSLLAALDDARALIEQGEAAVTTAPCTCGESWCDGLALSLTARIVAWAISDPAAVLALYQHAGMPPPSTCEPLERLPASTEPHGNSIAFRVRAALDDPRLWSIEDLMRVSGGSMNDVRTCIQRMRRRGARVVTTRRDATCFYQTEA